MHLLHAVSSGKIAVLRATGFLELDDTLVGEHQHSVDFFNVVIPAKQIAAAGSDQMEDDFYEPQQSIMGSRIYALTVQHLNNLFVMIQKYVGDGP